MCFFFPLKWETFSFSLPKRSFSAISVFCHLQMWHWAKQHFHNTAWHLGHRKQLHFVKSPVLQWFAGSCGLSRYVSYLWHHPLVHCSVKILANWLCNQMHYCWLGTCVVFFVLAFCWLHKYSGLFASPTYTFCSSSITISLVYVKGLSDQKKCNSSKPLLFYW